MEYALDVCKDVNNVIKAYVWNAILKKIYSTVIAQMNVLLDFFKVQIFVKTAFSYVKLVRDRAQTV